MNQFKKKPKTDIEDYVFNGKLPPQALDLEEAVLGAAMLENKAYHEIESLLCVEDFYSDSHKLIYASIKSLIDSNIHADILAVSQDLRKKGHLENAGGAFYVTQLTNRVASAANIEHHAAIIKQLSIKRNIIRICGEYGKKAFDDSTDAFELKDQVLGDLENVSKIESTIIQKLGDIARATLLKMKNDSLLEINTIGLESSIKAITNHTMGYSEPDLIIIGGGPGEGKTTFALQEAFHMAKNGHPVAFICMEMKSFQLCWKLFSAMIEESIMTIRMAKKISDPKWLQLEKIVKDMQNIPLYIVDATGQNINQITSLTKEFKRKHGIKMLFIDYLQLISGGSDKNYGTRELEVAYISRKLKENCMKMSLPTMALSQLTVEKGTKRMYELADLRESKAIGQNADGVGLLYWPDYHGVDTLNKEFYGPKESVIIWAKYRMAGRKVIRMKFLAEFNKFEDMYTQVSDAVNIPGKDISPPVTPDDDLPF